MKIAGAMLAAAVAVAPIAAAAHPHLWISQSLGVVVENGAYTHVEIEWKFDPHASEDEIPAIDEDKDGRLSEEEIRLLVRDMMPELQKSGFLTWLNTGDKDFRPPKVPAFDARIDNPASFTPPAWDRGAGDGERMPDNKTQTMLLPPKATQLRNLVYTMRFELPQPAKSFSITTYEPNDEMRIEVDKESLPAGCTLDRHSTYKSEYVPGQPVFADRVTCRLP
ncbi:MAG: DUF1007 family protein [Enhydrobacter sp.]|nr:DUF1007 family protein [Enhydrobacter sp.]